MGKNSRKKKKEPKTHNDQLGENASVEFAESYDNKGPKACKRGRK